MVFTGVYVNSYDQSLNVKNGFPVFNTLIEANYVGGAKAEFILTDEDKAEIHRLARDPRIGAPAPILVSLFIGGALPATWQSALRRRCSHSIASALGMERRKYDVVGKGWRSWDGMMAVLLTL